MKKLKIAKVLLAAAFVSVLVSCNEDIINYPTDTDSSIATITGDANDNVTDNINSNIYKQITSGSSVSAQCLDNILYKLASEKYLVASDPNGKDFSIADWLFKKRWQKEMLDTAKAGSYSVDNKFDEYRYALSLVSQMYDIKTSANSSALTDLAAATTEKIVITPDITSAIEGRDGTTEKDAKADAAFASVFKLNYDDYVARYFKPEIYRRYLTAYYIYNQTYTSIGNTLARNVTVIKITDRTDYPGAAKKVIDAFVKDYIKNTSATAEQADLHHLERLWKGITTDNSLTADDLTWYATNNIDYTLTGTLYGKINEDVTKIKTGNPYTTNSSLESTYTGSYTYPVEHGVELAKRTLEVNDLITEGTYLKSNGLSSLPSALKTRIFSTNFKDDLDKISTGEVKDVSFVTKHTDNNYYRYVTPETAESVTDIKDTDIVTYDSSSSSYYIVQMNSIVTPAKISVSDSDSAATAASKKALALDAAFEMSATEQYKKDGIIYYLENNKLDFSDPDFYSYIKTNYPDVIDFYD
jgi:hypothetical protein